MSKIVWIGPLDDVATVQQEFMKAGLQLVKVSSVDAVLAVPTNVTVPVVFVSLDVEGATKAVEQLARVRPDLQIVGATNRSVPPHVTLALQAGIGDIVNLRLDSSDILAERAREALKRHVDRLGELDFLRRVQALNEEFLKNTISLEKRNLQLEEQLRAEQQGESLDGTYRILVIDDEPTICALFEMLLGNEGYEIVTALDGESGMEAFRERPFQLVVTDKNLPGMSGLDVLHYIKKARPETDVVMITGYGSKDSAVEALNQGAIAYLEKPFNDIKAVEGTLEVIISRHQMRSRRRDYLGVIKDRNREFLERYRALRSDLENRIGKKNTERD